jgi:hypothetical protein
VARRPGEPWGGGLAADGDGQERGTANRQGRLEGVEKERDFSGRSVRLFPCGDGAVGNHVRCGFSIAVTVFSTLFYLYMYCSLCSLYSQQLQ